ncbi:MAG: alpha/beta hydrolase [Hyphomicrobiales bacterium]|nr:alpha/beta hydrolase [Hyphomicrobiales bacterium]
MPYATAKDGVRLYFEEVGCGTPVVFVHEYAADYRTWEPQLRFLSRQYRCVTFSARGYPPSDVPSTDTAYSQAIARDDVTTIMDHLAIDCAHIVGHSMGAYTTLHVGLDYPQRCRSLIVAGCGWGSDPAAREQAERMGRAIADMFRDEGIAAAADKYANFPVRLQHRAKDPRGWAEFVHWLSEHSAEGHVLTMLNVQLKRPTLYDLRDRLTKLAVPMLVVSGDEDDWCLDGSVFLKRTVPTAALLVLPRSGHTITSEEPEAFSRALFEVFTAVDAGRWMAHRLQQ